MAVILVLMGLASFTAGDNRRRRWDVDDSAEGSRLLPLVLEVLGAALMLAGAAYMVYDMAT